MVNGQGGREGVRVGFVLFVALIVLTAGLYVVAFKPTVVGDMVYYRAYFNETGGLLPGAPVWIGGVEVGAVEDVTFTPQELLKQGQKEIEVDVAVRRRFSDRVREDSVARIRTRGLLGEKIVTVTAGSLDKPKVPPGGTIPSEEGQDLEQAIQTAGAGVDRTAAAAVLALEELRQILLDIRKQRGILGKLIYSDEFYRETIARVDQVVEQVREELRGLTSMVQKEVKQFRSDASAALKSLEGEISHTGEEVRSTLREVNGNLKELSAVLGEIRQGQGTAALLLKDQQTASRLASSVEHLEGSLSHLSSIMEKIDSGQGTLGQLVNNRTVYTSLRDLFEGVGESWLLRDAIRSAEATGRQLRIERWKSEAQGQEHEK